MDLSVLSELPQRRFIGSRTHNPSVGRRNLYPAHHILGCVYNCTVYKLTDGIATVLHLRFTFAAREHVVDLNAIRNQHNNKVVWDILGHLWYNSSVSHKSHKNITYNKQQLRPSSVHSDT